MSKTIHHKKQGKIRIIGGKWKGKKITVISHPELRPTTNKIRETIFNWFTPIIQGAKCLDCFAGSGALGLEALSRDAHIVTFLEKNKTISNKLNQTIQFLKIKKNSKIITTNSCTWLQLSTCHIKPYDIVFIDPPFSKFFYIKNITTLLDKLKYITKYSWIYIESKKNNMNPTHITVPNTWELYKKKTEGITTYQIYIKY